MPFMDADASALLARLIRGVRVAALGTLRQGTPMVSMVAFLPEADFGSVCLRVSRLAWHTQDMLADPRVSLSIAEQDDGRADPQTLARVALRGKARALAGEGDAFERLKAAPVALRWAAGYAVIFGLLLLGRWQAREFIYMQF